MYQALYRKYRPRTFDDVVGQPAVTQTLKNQLLQNRLSHAYLFTGTRGTGKTSCAKILAKAVNCEAPVDGNPCNCCAACRSIEAGSCMDVLEIDAASNNGVDNVRALRDDAAYLPAEVKMRVYIIDEVHMLSLSAFNALLKIIEEPPEHLLFILATTELHKVPATILSRCQRFSFRRILPEDISDRLSFIAAREHIALTQEAANFLARLADGGLRDAVSLLDQCASASSGEIGTDEACRTLGLAGTRKTAELMQALLRHDGKQALFVFDQQYAEGKDLAAMLDELCTVARDLLIMKTANQSSSLISGICTQQELSALFAQASAGELLRITRLLRDAAAGFNTSANRRIDAELCLLRICSPEASLDAESINARLSRLEQKVKNGAILSSAQPMAQEPPVEETPVQEEAPPPVEPEPQTLPNGFWQELVQRLRVQMKPYYSAFFSDTPDAPVSGRVVERFLLLSAQDSFTADRLNKPEVLQTVTECASALLGRPVTAKFDTAQKNTGGTAALEQLISRGKQFPDIVELK